MSHRAGLDRSQTLLFPERLEDYVAAENPVRFLDAFVASLDLHALGFAKARCAPTGSPPYEPGMLLKLYLYGYLHRIRSSRLLEAECHRNVEVFWLTGKQAPDHKTIADFRKDNLKPLKAVSRQFMVLCRKLELFGAQLVGIDGTKLAGVNSKGSNFNEPKLAELLARADRQMADYLQQLDAADAAEPGEPSLTRAGLEAKIAALQDKQDWHSELLAQLDGQQKQISTTDPDARRMRGGSGGSVVGYNAQAAVDQKNKLIAAADVTNEETDLRQLGTMARQAQENLGVEKLEVVADTGYSTTAEVVKCEQHGITAYVPKADTSANTAQGLYGKSRFVYDAQKDVYVCPAGAALTYRFNTHELGRELRYYRASGCKSCALRKQCTRNQGNRTITREQDEAVMEAMAGRVKAHPEKMKLRKQLCEHPFGTIKRFFGYTYFLMKGLEKVRAEWSLMTLVYNLKRVLNLVSFAALIKAVGANVAPTA
jgi:transposase